MTAAGRLALALCLLLFPCAASGTLDPTAPDPGKDWRDGPVRYLLTPEEFERYGNLKSAEVRRAFVSRFWRRFDPDPDSPENGFKEMFDRLCALADQRFTTPLVAGWQTDRGRVLVLLGEPDAVQHVAGDPVSVAREIWTYNRRPGGRAEPLEIVFYGDRSGQFRLQPRPGAESEVYRDPVELWREIERTRTQMQLLGSMVYVPRELAQLYEQILPYEYLPGTLRSSLRRLRPVERNPSSRSVEPASGTESPPSPIVSDAAYFFQAADGGIMAMFVLEYRSELAAGTPADPSAPPPGPADIVASAWIIDTVGRLAGRVSPEVGVRLDRRPDLDTNGSMVFTGRAYLEAGTYETRFAVEDRARKSLAIRNVSLTVPDIPLGELAASTVVPAERFGPVAEGRRSPFAVGSEEVVPKPGSSFRRGEPLRIYFQVYGAARDAASLRPIMDVTFRFAKAGSHGFKGHGRPAAIHGANGESMGLTLPVDDWPVGDYRVEIDLVDRVSGAATSTEGFFRLAD